MSQFNTRLWISVRLCSKDKWLLISIACLVASQCDNRCTAEEVARQWPKREWFGVVLSTDISSLVLCSDSVTPASRRWDLKLHQVSQGVQLLHDGTPRCGISTWFAALKGIDRTLGDGPLLNWTALWKNINPVARLALATSPWVLALSPEVHTWHVREV